jgi:hypothetical protein
MKKQTILLGIFALMLVISLASSINVAAVGTPDEVIDVNGECIQTQLQSNMRTRFCFRERTQLTLRANVNISLEINCKASCQGNKDFIIEIDGVKNLQLVMNYSREEAQLGLLEGKTYTMRNRNTYMYREGFCVSIEASSECDCDCKCQEDCKCECDCQCECLYECQCICDCECQCINECQCICDCQCECLNECQCTCDCDCQCIEECQCGCDCDNECLLLQAKLRIRATEENRDGQWAYYDEINNEWVVVPTTIEDGYLTAETSHFSTWTIMIPENSALIFIGGSIAIAIVVTISLVYIKKRK